MPAPVLALERVSGGGVIGLVRSRLLFAPPPPRAPPTIPKALSFGEQLTDSPGRPEQVEKGPGEHSISFF